jgi:hypothetical protein
MTENYIKEGGLRLLLRSVALKVKKRPGVRGKRIKCPDLDAYIKKL